MIVVVLYILDLSKIEAGKLSFEAIDFELGELLTECGNNLGFRAQEKGLEIVCPAEAIFNRWYTSDPGRIRQVLTNLVGNAIKFTPRDGLITIRASRTPTSFILEFGDTGPGVPDEEGPHIFDAFFQGRREQGGQVAGTGIGLSVVRECVQAHDGTLELVNSDEFPGAHFRIEIPQRRDVAQQKLAANG